MKAVLRIIRYLKGTPGHGVLFKANGHLGTQVYTDADWAGDKGNRRSTYGYLTLVGGNLVTWRSKKQKVVALSSAEAEFQGVAQGLAKALWIRKLLSEIGYHSTQTSKIMCDNKAAIQILKIQFNMIAQNILSFEYPSACPLTTPSGRMEGDFEIKHIDKVGSKTFNVAVASFAFLTFGNATDNI
nr:putative ribonuclease H-like domain-containing protein [Tanacetum cinerariifolium]